MHLIKESHRMNKYKFFRFQEFKSYQTKQRNSNSTNFKNQSLKNFSTHKLDTFNMDETSKKHSIEDGEGQKICRTFLYDPNRIDSTEHITYNCI